MTLFWPSFISPGWNVSLLRLFFHIPNYIAVEPGYESATIRNTLLAFQRREIPIQTTRNSIISCLYDNRYHIFLPY